MFSVRKLSTVCICGAWLASCMFVSTQSAVADTDTASDLPETVEAGIAISDEQTISTEGWGWTRQGAQMQCQAKVWNYQDVVCGEGDIIYSEITYECREEEFAPPPGPVLQGPNAAGAAGFVVAGTWSCSCESVFYCTIGELE